jgi:LysR family hydrogen peroxide-inducible transcriptional activator
MVQNLFEEPFMAVLAKEHHLAKKDSLDLKSIENENILIFKDGDCFGEPIMQALSSINQHVSEPISLCIETQIRSLETLCYMVSSGLGISILPMSATQAPTFQSTNLVAVPFKNNILKRDIAMAWRASFPRHKAIDTIRKAIFSSQNIDTDKKTLAGLTS